MDAAAAGPARPLPAEGASWKAEVAARTALTVPCLTLCDTERPFSGKPKIPAFALKHAGYNEHGGYSYLVVRPERCRVPGFEQAPTDCTATCDRDRFLGKVSVRFGTLGPQARQRLCSALARARGKPFSGSCEPSATDDVTWVMTPRAAEVTLSSSSLELDCGIPRHRFAPTAEVEH